MADNKIIQLLTCMREHCPTDFLVKDWKLIGGNRHFRRFLWQKNRPGQDFPSTVTTCYCDVTMTENCYIWHEKTKTLLTVCTECVDRLIKEENINRCFICYQIHNNKSDNYCNDCRGGMLTAGKYKGKSFYWVYINDREYARCIATEDKYCSSSNLKKFSNWLNNKYLYKIPPSPNAILKRSMSEEENGLVKRQKTQHINQEESKDTANDKISNSSEKSESQKESESQEKSDSQKESESQEKFVAREKSKDSSQSSFSQSSTPENDVLTDIVDSDSTNKITSIKKINNPTHYVTGSFSNKVYYSKSTKNTVKLDKGQRELGFGQFRFKTYDYVFMHHRDYCGFILRKEKPAGAMKRYQTWLKTKFPPTQNK